MLNNLFNQKILNHFKLDNCIVVKRVKNSLLLNLIIKEIR